MTYPMLKNLSKSFFRRFAQDVIIVKLDGRSCQPLPLADVKDDAH